MFLLSRLAQGAKCSRTRLICAHTLNHPTALGGAKVMPMPCACALLPRPRYPTNVHPNDIIAFQVHSWRDPVGVGWRHRVRHRNGISRRPYRPAGATSGAARVAHIVLPCLCRETSVANRVSRKLSPTPVVATTSSSSPVIPTLVVCAICQSC